MLFIFGGRLNGLLKSIGAVHRHASFVGRIMSLLLLLGISVYGGFFNAGLGIIILSYLALAGYSDINAMNGLKLLVSSAVSVVAIVLFVHAGTIAWYEGTMVLLGTLVGGHVAAHFSRQLPQRAVRAFVIVASVGITGYFFYAG